MQVEKLGFLAVLTAGLWRSLQQQTRRQRGGQRKATARLCQPVHPRALGFAEATQLVKQKV